MSHCCGWRRRHRCRRGAAGGAAGAGGAGGVRAVSLAYFYEADHDAVIESLRRPIGRPNDFAPVVSAQFLRERYDAVTIG